MPDDLDLTSVDPEARTRALTRRGLSRVESEDFAGALSDFEVAERIAREAGMGGLVAAARVNQGYAYEHQGDPETALRLYAEAADLAWEAEDAERHRVALGNVCILLRESGRYEEAVAALSDFLEVLDGDAGACASAYYDRGLCHLALGSTEDARADFEEASGLARESAETDVLASARYSLAVLYDQADDLPSAVLLYREVVDLTQKAGLEEDRRQALASLAQALRRLGNYSDADATFAELEEIDRRSGDSVALADTLYSRAFSMSNAGWPDRALEKLREEEPIRRDLGDATRLGHCLAGQGDMLRAVGKHAEAQAAYTAAEEAYRPTGPSEALTNALYWHGRSLRHTGDSQAALACADEAIDVARACDYPLGEVRARGLRAMCLADLGDTVPAIEELLRADDRCESVGLYAQKVWIMARPAYVFACEKKPADEVVEQLRFAHAYAVEQDIAPTGRSAVRKMTSEILKRCGDEYAEPLSALADELDAESAELLPPFQG